MPNIVFIHMKGKRPFNVGELDKLSSEDVGWYILEALKHEVKEMRVYAKDIDPHCSGCLGLTEAHVCERRKDGSQDSRRSN